MAGVTYESSPLDCFLVSTSNEEFGEFVAPVISEIQEHRRHGKVNDGISEWRSQAGESMFLISRDLSRIISVGWVFVLQDWMALASAIPIGNIGEDGVAEGDSLISLESLASYGV
jgi:hypothetical protein